MGIEALRGNSAADLEKKLAEQTRQAGVQQQETASIFGSKADEDKEVTLAPDAQALLAEAQAPSVEDEAIAAAEAAKADEGAAKAEEAAKAAAADTAKEVEGAAETGEVSSADVEKIKEEKEKLEAEKKENLEKMEKLEKKIEEKAKDAEDNIMAAAAQQEQQVEDHKEESQQVLNENINAYIAANKEGGEGMTREELQQNIQGALPNAPAAAEAMAALTAASEDVNEMDSYLSSLNDLIQDTNKIDTEIKALDDAEAAAEEAAAKKAEEAKKQCCDPIGFTMGEGEEQVRYDFIKNDGAFDTTSDFLGAENNWAEMEALDTDGDKVVTAEELKAGGIQAVKTDKAGNKSTVDFAEEFGDDFSIDLNSYSKGGSHDAIDTTSGAQELMGTFDLNIGGESVNGYNTLDDVNFLESNYGVTNDIESVTEEAEETATQYSEDLQPHVNFFETYTQKSLELKEEISKGFGNLGLTEEQINEINNITKKDAAKKAEEFMGTLGAQDTDEAEKAEEAEEADETDETADAEVAEEAEVTAEETTETVADAQEEQNPNEQAEDQEGLFTAENSENPFAASSLSAEEDDELKLEELMLGLAA